MSKTSCKRVRESGAKMKVSKSGRSEEMPDEGSETNGLQEKATNETRSIFFLAAQGRQLHLKVPLGKV
jgi:hypothetical protein